MNTKLIIAILIIFSLDIVFEVNFPKINEVLIESDKVEEETRIIQISDLHGKKLSEGFLQEIRENNPDIIVLTGDLIDKRTNDYNEVYAVVEALALNKVPLFYVSGNHDLSHKHVKIFYQELEKRGVTILDDKKTKYKDIDIYGFDYYSDASEMKELEDKFSLLLVHDAFPLIKQGGNGFDLILSGHTHGGQVRAPFFGAIFVPGQGFFALYDKGLFSLNEKTRLYIDSGIGNTFLPLRFLNRSQASLIRIYSK